MTDDTSLFLGAAVLGFPNIVKHIFEYLPAKALCTGARVCKLWRQQAELVLRQRRQHYWELFEAKGSRSYTAVCSSVEQFIQELPVCPSLILLYLTDKLWKRRYSAVDGRRKKQNLVEKLADIVPSACRIICSSTYGIIGTSSNLSRTQEVEQSEAVTVLCFGLHPGVEFVPFDWNAETEMFHNLESQRTAQNASERELEMQQGDFWFFPRCPDLKAVLTICNSDLNDALSLLYSHFRRPLIAGGFVNALTTNTCVTDSQAEVKWGPGHLSCLGIRGENVQVASVAFPQFLCTPEEAESVVQALKEKSKNMSLKHAVAFMFACVARGEECYGKPNVESSAFRKHFPSVPIFGFFGNGEIGYEYPLEAEPKKDPELLHQYTTFMVLLCLP